jgi:hypothetical protein
MKLAQRQALVTIEGIPGLWATKSGGNVSADTTPVWDGGADTPEILAAPAAAENVSVSRPFDDLRDLPELARLRRLVGKFRGTITVQPTNGDLFPVGPATVYPDALLVTLEEPEFDASSGDAQTIGLEFAIAQYV